MRVRQLTFAFVLSVTTSHPSAWSVPASSHLALAGRRSGTGHVDDFHGRRGEAPWISKVVHGAPVPSRGTCVLLSSEDSSRRILRFADPRVHVRGLHPAVSAMLRRSRSSSFLPSRSFRRFPTHLPSGVPRHACERMRGEATRHVVDVRRLASSSSDVVPPCASHNPSPSLSLPLPPSHSLTLSIPLTLPLIESLSLSIPLWIWVSLDAL